MPQPGPTSSDNEDRPGREDRSPSGAGLGYSTVRDHIGLPFTIFRARDALNFDESGVMQQADHPSAPTDPDGPRQNPRIAEAMEQMMENGVMDGTRTRLMFARPGLSLSYAWFKSGFPLPRHSHDADCLYLIIGGSLRIGTEELGTGDGFFVGKDVPYAYVPGPDGVEVLEFRTADNFDIKLLANNPAWWDKAATRLSQLKPHWDEETAPPSGIAIGQPGP